MLTRRSPRPRPRSSLRNERTTCFARTEPWVPRAPCGGDSSRLKGDGPAGQPQAVGWLRRLSLGLHTAALCIWRSGGASDFTLLCTRQDRSSPVWAVTGGRREVDCIAREVRVGKVLLRAGSPHTLLSCWTRRRRCVSLLPSSHAANIVVSVVDPVQRACVDREASGERTEVYRSTTELGMGVFSLLCAARERARVG